MKSLIITTALAALLLAVSTKGFACEIAEAADSDFGVEVGNPQWYKDKNDEYK